MRILLFGANGQVGWELQRALQPLGEVEAVGREQADFNDPDSLRRCFANSPDVVVNAAAYTAVDQAEADVERALRINGQALEVVADEVRRLGALLVHYSTDYVFDGAKAGPYVETDPPNPLGVYGRSKLAGERAIAESGCDFLILRTSWVYARRGSNFVKSILRLARERDALRVVGDEAGAPTGAALIADCTAHLVWRACRQRDDAAFESEILHLVAAGETTWYDIAVRVIARATAAGALHDRRVAVEPIPASAYPLAAARPANSRLDTHRVRERYGLVLPHWTVGIDQCLDELLSR